MRRSDHPSRPSAMTCCLFSSLKTLLTLTEVILASGSMSCSALLLAGFQLIIIGRFWVIPDPSVMDAAKEPDSIITMVSGAGFEIHRKGNRYKNTAVQDKADL
jgi:hypothetical protein